MGIFSRKPEILEAQIAPKIMGDGINSIYNFTFPVIGRRDAMAVPAIKRCRDLLCLHRHTGKALHKVNTHQALEVLLELVIVF